MVTEREGEAERKLWASKSEVGVARRVRVGWAAALCLSTARADAAPTVTLEASFRALAECEPHAKADLDERLRFIKTLGSEEAVRALPEHVARNEQERMMRLQRTLLRPGLAVALVSLPAAYAAYQPCQGTLLACADDGSFRCVVELSPGCGDVAEFDSEDGVQECARVHASQLAPARDCGVESNLSCAGDVMERTTALAPLTLEGIGQAIAESVHLGTRLAETDPQLKRGVRALGPTAWDDLPYAVLALVLDELARLGHAALAAGDSDGARLAAAKGLELEVQSRHDGVDESELPRPVRRRIAELLSLRASCAHAGSDPADAVAARADALSAQRLNVSSSVSSEKLLAALRRARARGRARNTDEAARLLEWYQGLVDLSGEPVI